MTGKSPNATQQLASSGVETLIERLRDQGVAAGRKQAAQIVSEAEEKAAAHIAEAENRARQIVEAARREAQSLAKGGEEALRIAMRDSVLRLKSELSSRFSDEVKRLISAEMQQQDFLKRLILEVAAQARTEAGVDSGQSVEVRLPQALVSPEELRKNPLELREGSLSHFALSLAGNVLADGVTFAADRHEGNGIRLYLKDQDVHIDLTDDKVAAILLAHLQPRFRAILEGTVR